MLLAGLKSRKKRKKERKKEERKKAERMIELNSTEIQNIFTSGAIYGTVPVIGLLGSLLITSSNYGSVALSFPSLFLVVLFDIKA